MSDFSLSKTDISFAVECVLRSIHPTLSLNTNAKNLLEHLVSETSKAIVVSCLTKSGDVDFDSVKRRIQYTLPPRLIKEAAIKGTHAVIRQVNDLMTFQLSDDSDSTMENSPPRPTKRKRRSVVKTIKTPSAKKPTKRRQNPQAKKGEVKPTGRKTKVIPTKYRKRLNSPEKDTKLRQSTSNEDEGPRKRGAPKKRCTEAPKGRTSVSSIKTTKAVSKLITKPAVVKKASAKQKCTKAVPKETSGINFIGALKTLLPYIHNDEMFKLSKNGGAIINLMLFDIFQCISKNSETTDCGIAIIVNTEFPTVIAYHAQAVAQRDLYHYVTGLLEFKPSMDTNESADTTSALRETSQSVPKMLKAVNATKKPNFPLEDIFKELSKGGKKVDPEAVIYAGAVLEYFAAELLEISGNAARSKKKTIISKEDVLQAISQDNDMREVFAKYL